MPSVIKGMLAGFAGTVLLSALMVMKSMMGVMPELDIIKMLSTMMSAPAGAAWIAHFGLGTVVWGGLFSAFNGQIPGSNQITKGIVFGLGAWVMMMLVVMPMAGQGLFGLNLGVMAPVMTAMLHVIFGAVMGWVYAQLTHPSASTA